LSPSLLGLATTALNGGHPKQIIGASEQDRHRPALLRVAMMDDSGVDIMIYVLGGISAVLALAICLGLLLFAF